MTLGPIGDIATAEFVDEATLTDFRLAQLFQRRAKTYRPADFETDANLSGRDAQYYYRRQTTKAKQDL